MTEKYLNILNPYKPYNPMAILVSLEEAIKIFEEMKKWFDWKSDYQTWIKSWIEACVYKLALIPTIDIDKIIDGIIEFYESSYSELSPEEERIAVRTLQELKERLSLTK